MLIARLFFVFFPALIAWLICAAALQAIACPAPFWAALIPAAAVAATGWIVTAPHPERGELEITPELINREWPRRTSGLQIFPTREAAETFSKDRVAPLTHDISAEDIEAIEQTVGRSALSWDLVEPHELVTAILNHFNNKAQKA